MPIVKIVPMPGPSGSEGAGDIFSVEIPNQRTGTAEVLQFTDSTKQSAITGSPTTAESPTANRLVVAGQDGHPDTSGEGGDIYLWAGRGGSANGSGGDIKVDAGNGGGDDGSGGTIKVRGGYSQTSGGGFVQIYAGDSSEGSGGYLELRAGSNYTDTESYGGAVDIEAGGSGNAMGGGNINLRTYQAGKILLSGDGGEFLNDSSDPDNQIATIADIQAATTADFVFTDVDANNSSMTITGDKEMTIESGAESDLNVRAGDQLWLTAGNDVILQADDTVQVRSLDGVEILSNYVDMGDAEHRWQFTQGAELILPGGGVIVNAPESSSDGGLLSTLLLVPDGTNETNQFVVLDPTGPNHIHIRAGGTIDESTAELILGGERNKVVVSDSYKSVGITTAATITNTYVNANEASNADLLVPDTSDILLGDNIVIAGIGHPVTYFSPDPNNTGFSIVRATGVTFVAGDLYTFVREEPYENYWSFNSNGVFSGPAMGGVKVPAIANTGPDDDLYIYVNGANADLRLQSDQDINLYTEYGDILLSADGGAYIGSASPENEIATAGDIAYRRVDVPSSSIGQLSDVAGLVADDASYHYYCTGAYDGDTHIWKRIAWSNDTWPGV